MVLLFYDVYGKLRVAIHKNKNQKGATTDDKYFVWQNY